MIRFAANLSMMYQEREFLERFAAARSDGFVGVEFMFPYSYPKEVLRRRLHDEGLKQVLFNAPAGDWSAGDRGLAALPDREAEFRESFGTALEYAVELDCSQVHVMAGVARPGQVQPQHGTYLRSLEWAASLAEPLGIDLLIEPLNARDVPGYLITTQAEAHGLVAVLGRPNVGVQLDLYHLQISEGDVTMTLRRDLPTGRVRHVQIAGVPDRHEPDLGELDVTRVLATIESLDYAGWVGCEYTPHHDTTSGLAWIETWERHA